MDKLNGLRIDPQRINFKDEWGIDFTCAYEPTYPVWQIAANLNSPFDLLPPGCLKRDIYHVTPLGKCYSLNGISINEIAALASEIWRAQFEPKMREALFELFLETRALTLLELAKRFPGKAPSIDSKKLFNKLFNVSNENRRRRLHIPVHGGDRRSNKSVKGPNILILYALHVVMLKHYWAQAIADFEKENYRRAYLAKFKTTSLFEILSCAFPVQPEVLEDLLNEIYKRAVEKKPEYQPLGLALKHANAILPLSAHGKYNTLRSCYQEGLKQARKYRKYYRNTVLDEMFFSKIGRPRRKTEK
ncbi:MAG TPA: hypothetical protein VF543_22090 [Pyrinomonadaceae bacterium]|jgi:hypothetical protein